MELDELKLAWHTLERRLETRDRLEMQRFKQERLDRVQHGLWPMRIGQIARILFGIALMGFAAPVWTQHWPQPLIVACGLVVHAYGIAECLVGGRLLWQIGGIDYAAPVVAIQRQLARLRASYLRSSYWLGNAWWVMWVPVLFVAAVWGNPSLPDAVWNESMARATRFVAVSVLFGLAAIVLVALGMRLWRQRHPDSLRRFEDRSSRGIAHAQKMLDDISRFEK